MSDDHRGGEIRQSRSEALKRVLTVVERFFNNQTPRLSTSLLASDLGELRVLIEEAEVKEARERAQVEELRKANREEWRRRAFYFGCVERPGHSFWDIDLRSFYEAEEIQPWGPHIDGKLPPDFDATPWQRERGYGGRTQPEGVAKIHHKDGWTAMAFWDRSVDNRMGCNSNFFFEGTYDFIEMVVLAKKWFPSIWERFPFRVQEQT